MRFLVLAFLLWASSASAADSITQSCQRFYQKFFSPYQRLAKLLPAQNSLSEASKKFLQTSSSVCADAAVTKDFIKQTSVLISEHRRKVGVVFGLSEQGREQRNWLYAGMQAFLQNKGLAETNTVVIRDTLPNTALWEQALAQLVLVDQVTSVVVSLPRSEHERVAGWAQDLAIPIFILGSNRKDKPINAYSFHVWPVEKSMAATLARYTADRGIKRIAVLRPTRNFAASFDSFLQAFKKVNIEIVDQQNYTPNDFGSMEAAVRKLFAIERSGREQEFEEAFKKKKAAAEAAGIPLNAHEVLLPPMVRMDAIFIPDNFKSIRHFVKMMRSFQVRELPLIGTQEWRARNLVDPPESFLNSSFFADTINTYQNLPFGIAVATAESPYFVNPSESFHIDLKIIGYNAMQLAMKAVQNKQEKRFRLATEVARLKYDPSPYFPPGPVFDSAHNAQWPTYLFRLAPRRLELIPRPLQPLAETRVGHYLQQ